MSRLVFCGMWICLCAYYTFSCSFSFAVRQTLLLPL